MNISIISPGKFKKKPPLEEIFNYYKKRINLKIDLKKLKHLTLKKEKSCCLKKMKLQNILNQQTILWYLIKMVKCFQVKTFRFFKKKNDRKN